MTAPNDTPHQPWYRQFWPWFLIALPGVIVIASFYMLYLALSHDDSRVRDNYYKEGLAINRTLAQDQRATQLGLSASLALAEGGARVHLRGGFEAPPPQLLLQLIHPLDSDRDVDLELRAIGGGDYVTTPGAVLPQPLEGRWYIELHPVGDDDGWRLRDALYLGQRQQLELRPQTPQPGAPQP
jgi:hypothetical protein